ncbi:MAG: hypothetical protein ACRDEA_05440 [Microcystaceae cyanobacterium]
MVDSGDIGLTQQERDAKSAMTDFVFVFGEDKEKNNPLLADEDTLFFKTVSNCTRQPKESGGFKESRGYIDGDPQKGVCGPNIHSVSATKAQKNQLDITVNGKDFFTDMLNKNKRGDEVDIPATKLAEFAADGTILLTLWPNPGASGYSGVYDIKYKSAILEYEIPERNICRPRRRGISRNRILASEPPCLSCDECTIVNVPEPSSAIGLLAFGALGVGLELLRKQKQQKFS